MAIHIITGLTGTGKTYFMTRLAQKMVQDAKIDWSLYANYHLKAEGFAKRPIYFDNPMDFLKMERAIVLIDDGAIWFGSRQWAKLPWEVQHKIINNRKDGIQVFVTTQFFESLDRTFRENCHKYYECEKLIGSQEHSEKIWGIIRVRRFPPRLYDKIRRKPLETHYFFLRKKYADLYDTYEKVAPRPFDGSEGRKMIKEAREQLKNAFILSEKRKRGRPSKTSII
jgi:hypothetical protein